MYTLRCIVPDRSSPIFRPDTPCGFIVYRPNKNSLVDSAWYLSSVFVCLIQRSGICALCFDTIPLGTVIILLCVNIIQREAIVGAAQHLGSVCKNRMKKQKILPLNNTSFLSLSAVGPAVELGEGFSADAARSLNFYCIFVV